MLGVDVYASEAEIVRAFRRLALQHHPDRNGGTRESADRFREVKAAYDALRGKPAAARPAAPRERAPAPREPEFRGDTNHRSLDPAKIARVHERLARLNKAIARAIANPSSEHIADVIDAARWARLDVDTVLALKGHVPDLRDGHWATLGYTDRRTALATLAAFAEAQTGSDIVAMRNLRARLDGLLAVARGLAAAL